MWSPLLDLALGQTQYMSLEWSLSCAWWHGCGMSLRCERLENSNGRTPQKSKSKVLPWLMWSGGGTLGQCSWTRSYYPNTEYKSIERRQRTKTTVNVVGICSSWSSFTQIPHSDKALLLLNPQGAAHRFTSWLMNLWLPFSIHIPSHPSTIPSSYTKMPLQLCWPTLIPLFKFP